MPVRDDVYIDWKYRIITVEAPSTEVTVADLITTARTLETQLDGSDDQSLLNADGATVIDATQRTALACELINAFLAFEQRTASVASGTATAGDPDGYTLTDSAAPFASVEPGATVVNLTKGGVATVLEVLDNSNLRHLRLADGATKYAWEIGDSYKVWNAVQCEVKDGNLTAVDDVGDPMNPFFPTAFTHATRSLAISGVILSADLQAVGAAVLDAQALDHDDPGTVGQVLNWLRRRAYGKVEQRSGNPGILDIYNDAGDTVIASMQLLDENGNAIVATTGVPMRSSGIAWPPT